MKEAVGPREHSSRWEMKGALLCEPSFHLFVNIKINHSTGSGVAKRPQEEPSLPRVTVLSVLSVWVELPVGRSGRKPGYPLLGEPRELGASPCPLPRPLSVHSSTGGSQRQGIGERG